MGSFRPCKIIIFLILSVVGTQNSPASSRVISWGFYWKSKINIFVPVSLPPTLNEAISVAAGAGHSLALLANGTVIAWGDNSFQQASVPLGVTGVVAIAAGDYHSLALRSDGTVVAWGDNTDGQLVVPRDLTNAIAISAGYFHSLALRA